MRKENIQLQGIASFLLHGRKKKMRRRDEQRKIHTRRNFCLSYSTTGRLKISARRTLYNSDTWREPACILHIRAMCKGGGRSPNDEKQRNSTEFTFLNSALRSRREQTRSLCRKKGHASKARHTCVPHERRSDRQRWWQGKKSASIAEAVTMRWRSSHPRKLFCLMKSTVTNPAALLAANPPGLLAASLVCVAGLDTKVYGGKVIKLYIIFL